MTSFARRAGFFRRLLFITIIVVFQCVTLSWAESEKMQNTPVKAVAVIHCDYPPVSFLDKKTNRHSGYFVDIMDSVAGRAGLQIDYICKDGWAEMIEAIENREADLGALLKSEEREKRLMFSTPIDVTYLSFFARSQSSVDTDRVPQGYTVGVVKGSMSYEQLKDRPLEGLHQYGSYQEGIFGLLAGEVGLFGGEESMILKRARETGLEDRIRKVGRPFIERERGIAVRKDDVQLIGSLNKALKGFIGSPEYQEIYLKWYGRPSPFWTSTKILAAGGVSLALIVFCMALWRYISISRLNRELKRNINDRQQAEKVLRESEEKYRSVVENIGIGISVISPEMKILALNRQMKEWFPKIDLATGPVCYRVFNDPPGKDVCRNCPTTLTLRDGEVHELITETPAGGTRTNYWVKSSPIKDKGGNITAVIEIVEDITERRRAEEALRKNEELVRSVIDSVDEGFIVVGPDYRILTANRAYCSQVNAPACDVVGRHCYEVSHKSSGPCFQAGEDCAVRRVFLTGLPCTAYHKHSDAEGNMLYVEAKAFPLKDASGAVTSVIESILNITEKHLLEQERLKTQKLEAIGTLAGGIAHDFNNLLQGVFGYISLARLQKDNGEKCVSSLEQAEKALHMSVKLTNQLLTFSKGGKPLKKMIDLRPLTENAAKFALSGSRSVYRITADEDLWMTEADEGQIGQVVQNIVLNAEQAMPEGGGVEITERNVEYPGKDLPQGLQNGSYVEIAIKDSGTGIHEQYITKIFDPYFTTKARGSGLGLATSYSMIKNHNGLIDVRSKVGVGTTFFIYLPAALEEEKEEPLRTITAAPEGLRGRVLVMDDEELIRDVAGELLKALGHEVAFAAHGEEAIGIYRSAIKSGGCFDAVILDLTIRGGMGGVETVKKLNEIDPGVKAIASSGYSDNSATSNFQQQGFRAFLKKPYYIDELRDVLNSLLAP